MPVEYEVNFRGSLIIRNMHSAQTNTNASFSFLFTIVLSDQTVKISEQSLHWQLSSVKNDNSLPLFPKLWDVSIEKATNHLVYSIMLQSGDLLTINKQGKRSPVGLFLEALLPSFNYETRTKNNSINLLYTNELNQEKSMEGNTIAWDFIREEPNEDVLLVANIRQNRDEIISKIYKSYEKKNKARIPTLFWFQNTVVSSGRPYQQMEEMMNISGVYEINMTRQILEQAHASGQLRLSTSTQNNGSITVWDIELNGIFILKEKEKK